MHRAETCRAKLAWLNKPAIEPRARNPDEGGRGVRNVFAHTQPSDEQSSRGQRTSKRGDPCRVAPFLLGCRRLGCDFGLLQHFRRLPVFPRWLEAATSARDPVPSAAARAARDRSFRGVCWSLLTLCRSRNRWEKWVLDSRAVRS